MIKQNSIATILASIIFLSGMQNSSAIEKIIINGLFKNKAIVTIDGKQRVLKKGMKSPEGALLIESNSKEAIIEINGEQKTYLLGSHIGGNFAPATEGKKLIVTPDSAGMYNISGTINGSHVAFVVDTGATLVSMNSNIAKKLGIDYKLIGKKGLSNTASGTSEIYIINLKKVKVGDIELRNVKGAVHEGDFPVTTLLGMSFLGKLDMKREGRIMELQKKY
ncbi:MAG: retroviral-like aspartic protease family protein [Proteobacteria bacterium]|nr:TIGR02281 family clan AA aspartic protease [Pseudomonadota bacterium]NOG59356.1 retroviral-like aspartic protease family protein [Pseudomonadota bacterium]